MKQDGKLSLISLIGIIMSAIIGAGIFNLMKEMASVASVGATMIGWIVTGVGMGSLALCMLKLNTARPDLDAGIFSYAREGFGDYIGFNSVWGYWISVIIGNVAFGTLLFSALGYFFPVFGDGQNIASIIGASVLLWIIHYMLLKGLDKAALLNAIVMLAKLIPLVIFLICIVTAFKINLFAADFWGNNVLDADLGSVVEQVKGSMLVTVWVFIGIEGAVVFSGRARNRSDVGRATVLAFIAITIIYAMITVLSFGILTRADIASLPNPAMGYVLESIIGKTGAIIVNVGVIISIFGAWIANTLLAEEIAYQAGVQQLFPKCFTIENKNGMPAVSTFITNFLVQLLLISFLFTSEAYSVLSRLSSATILLPYACVAFFLMKEIVRKKIKAQITTIALGLISSIYMLWLIISSGYVYVVLTILALCPGTLIYIYVKKYYKEKMFTAPEYVILTIVGILFIYGICNLSTLLVG
ncbi:basic amino acid/polyamine antiporter [Granulicatella elegans]|uniref:basic amino acid/polyamine antiporter n=1 Tax=Granulicatella elegans TaxID=137732 RepID=UPI001D140691|nr:basic amino acid/polyamine antiporter [Granulicatella elegans]UEA31621.1 basic amino acid/polyamine antiporter [Granulicatella elegans]